MKPYFNGQQAEIAEICQRYGVRRMEAYDATETIINTASAPADVGFLIALENEENIGGYELLDLLLGMEKDLGQLLQCPVHVSRRQSIEESHNPVLRRSLLRNPEVVYG